MSYRSCALLPFVLLSLLAGCADADPTPDDADIAEDMRVVDATPDQPDASDQAHDSDAAPTDSGSDGDMHDADMYDADMHDAEADQNPQNPVGQGPAPVMLGSVTDLSTPGSYVLLAKTGITNVTGSSITGGHLGVSPAPASYITGMSLVADATNTFSTSASVPAPWKIYAANDASPTPARLTSAVLAMELAYSDAASRTEPDFLNLSSGQLGGLTLAPGLYTWGSSVTIPTEVTLAGGANDVWIFQISNDLDLSANTRITLSGGADPANIFWQVAGEVVIHAGAHFEGIILSQTAVTLQTRASLVGRVLAQSLIALDDNAVTAP